MRTESCKADTDDDGVRDGYEYRSARDLNNGEYERAIAPLPDKNLLVGIDAGTDFDGDSLIMGQEHSL